VTVVAAIVAEWAATALGEGQVPEELLALYRDAAFPPLLLSAIVIAAPWFEEIFFRGFFFRGIAVSRLGAAGAVLLGSAIWTSLHCSYPPVHMSIIFVLGLLLGVVRWQTGSVTVTILMHAVWNAISSAEVYWFVHASK
jgi:membrane protease YdiL (CAAX protease family)